MAQGKLLNGARVDTAKATDALASVLVKLTNGALRACPRDLRDVLAGWIAQEVLGARSTAQVAGVLNVSPPTAWRVLDALRRAYEASGLIPGSVPVARFTGEMRCSPVNSPAKGPPGGKGGPMPLGSVLVQSQSDPTQSQAEQPALRAAVLKGNLREDDPFELAQTVARYRLQRKHLAPEDVERCLEWMALQWDGYCLKQRDPFRYGVKVAINRAKELRLLPMTGEEAAARLRRLVKCEKCGKHRGPGMPCDCPA